MQINRYVTIAEVGLIVEALQRAAKRQQSEAKWHSNAGDEHLSAKHDTKASAMLKIINKLQPMTGLQGLQGTAR